MEKDILYLKIGDYILMESKSFSDYSLPELRLNGDKNLIKDKEKRLKNLIDKVKDNTGIEPLRPELKGNILFKDNESNENTHINIYFANSYTNKINLKKSNIFLIKEEDQEFVEHPENKLISQWINEGKRFVGYIEKKQDGSIDDFSFAEFFW